MRAAAPTAILAIATFAAIVATSIPSCSIGSGSGSAKGVLDVPDCWSGSFDLTPDFFAAVPYRTSLQLRMQNGGDYETFSDGIAILVDDITAIRGGGPHHLPSLYGQALEVALPPSVVPPGVPITPTPNPASVHLALYLLRSCHTQNPALYAMSAVTLNGAGGCDPRHGGEPTITCEGSRVGVLDAGTSDAAPANEGGAGAPDAGGAGDAGVSEAGTPGQVGHSQITFTSLFDGDPEEVSANERLNAGTFQVYLADPREICPGGLGPPPPCRGYLEGSFKFYFERGKPAQPFP